MSLEFCLLSLEWRCGEAFTNKNGVDSERRFYGEGLMYVDDGDLCDRRINLLHSSTYTTRAYRGSTGFRGSADVVSVTGCLGSLLRNYRLN